MTISFQPDEHPILFLRPRVSLPYAWVGHIPFAYLAVDLLRPRTLVELGTDSGNSYLAFCQAAKHLGLEQDVRFVAIDSWRGDEHARFYGDEVYHTLKSYHDPLYAGFSRLFRSYFDEAAATFDDASIDLLHIDGLHTYEAVKHDFETWLPKLSDRAVVLLHDSAVKERSFGVWRFLKELKQRYPVFEFRHSNGLGVVLVGRQVPNAFQSFFDRARAHPDVVRDFFESIAATVLNEDGITIEHGDVVEGSIWQVYYRQNDEGFDDGRSVTGQLAGSNGKFRLTVTLPASARPDFIRIDPANAPGVFSLRELALSSDHRSMSLNSLHGRLGHVNGDLLPQRQDGEIRLVNANADPYVEIEVADLVAAFEPTEGIRLELLLQIDALITDPRLWQVAEAHAAALVDLRKEAATNIEFHNLGRQIRHFESSLAAQLKAASKQTVQALLESRDELQAEVIELQRQQDVAQEIRAQLERKLALRDQAAQLLTLERDNEREAKKRLAVRNDEFAERLALSERRVAAANQEIEVRTKRLSELQEALDDEVKRKLELQKIHEASLSVVAVEREDLALLRSRYAALAQELGSIKGSTLWRVMQRLIGPLSRLSPPQRNRLRRMAKAAWWVVTPHRMPMRLQFLRQRKAIQSRSSPAMVSVSPPSDAGVPNSGQANSPPHLPKGLRFIPSPEAGSNGHIAPQSGRYELNAEKGVYSYIPLREPEDLALIIAGWPQRPFLSVIVPVYNTPVDLLRKLLASVTQQWYSHWQLILVNDNSSTESTLNMLSQIDDPRIVVIHLQENRGISGATNVGLENAKGDYIVFLDHDDELTTDCLYEIAKCIQEHDPDFIYSDEDKIDTDGSFTQPFFKPDWSPDAMMSTMYTCHVSCVRRTLAQELGGLRSEYDGSQDWDFILRVTERTSRIVHLPKVLYHWRIIPASVSSDLSAKPYAVDAGRRAREDALRRRGLRGELRPVAQLPGYYRTHYHLQGHPLFSIVIPSKNNGSVLRKCVDSIIAKSSYRHFEIIVIDNGSSDADTLAHLDNLRDYTQVKVVRYDVPFNYSEINNFGVKQSKGDILVFLNDDTEVLTENWLESLGGYAQLKHVGAVGAKLLYPQTLHVQHNGILNLSDGPNHAFHQARKDDPGYFARNLLEYDWIAVTGACLVVERGKFDEVSGFDEVFPVSYNDVELCFRLVERGFYNVVCPGVELLHYESLTRGLDAMDDVKRARLEQEKLRLYQKHPRFYMHDPFYNPNLAANDVYFSLP